jgi:hypothetical protein
MSTTMEMVRSKGTDGKGSDKGTDKGTEEEDVKKGPAKGSKVGAFFKAPDEDDEKVLKWRFLAKGEALAAILAVFGARAVEGDKQVAFKVEEAGDLELGDVVRHLFAKAHAAGVVLSDLVALIEAKEAEKEKAKS